MDFWKSGTKILHYEYTPTVNENNNHLPLGREHHRTVQHMDMILSACLHPNPSANVSVLVN